MTIFERVGGGHPPFHRPEVTPHRYSPNSRTESRADPPPLASSVSVGRRTGEASNFGVSIGGLGPSFGRRRYRNRHPLLNLHCDNSAQNLIH